MVRIYLNPTDLVRKKDPSITMKERKLGTRGKECSQRAAVFVKRISMGEYEGEKEKNVYTRFE